MQVKAWILRNKTLLSVVGVLVLWAAIFYFLPPDALVERVGIGNAYVISFLVTLLAGFSALTGTAAYATVIEFSRGGVDPLPLGIVSGIGLFLSDSIFYLLVMRGREALSTRLGTWFWRFHQFMERLPDALIYIATYLFCAIGPIPDDVIIGVLIIGGYEYKKVWPAFLAGDITFMLFLCYLFH